LPGHIPAGEVKIRGVRNINAYHFGAGRRLKRALMGVVEVHALSRRRDDSQQRSKRATMHHADALMLGRLEGQGVDILPPRRRFAVRHQLIVCTAGLPTIAL